MDAGSINEVLLKNLQQLQQTQVNALSKLLGLKLGSEFSANVQKILPVSPEQRAQLQEQTQAALAQLNKNSAAPAVKASIQQLEAQLKLLQNPQLKWVELQLPPAANNPLSGQPKDLLTYTDKALQLGQSLLIRLDGQKLLLLEPSAQPNAGKVSSPAASSDLDALLGANQTQLRLALNAKTMEAISNSLRSLLPLKDQPQELWQALPKLSQFIQQLPPTARREWVSQQLQQALATLGQQVRTPAELADPQQLQAALKESGISFEQKLAASLAKVAGTTNPLPQQPLTKPQLSAETQASAKPAANQLLLDPTKLSALLNKQPQALAAKTEITAELPKSGIATKETSTSIQPALVTSLAKQSLGGSTALGKNPVDLALNQPTKSSVNSGRSPEQIAARDLKGALLGLSNSLTEELTSLGATSTGAQALADISKAPQLPNLMQLLGQLGNRQLPELTQKVLRAQLVMLLQQQTFGSLAKVQLQQLHSLNHQQDQLDSPLPGQSWQLDIPMRQGQELHHLQMHWEQQWVDVAQDQEEVQRKSSTKQRQWNVMLQFDLPVVGKFVAQLQLLGNQLSARLWAEQEPTLEDAKRKTKQLQAQLEQQGVEVTQIQCLPGLPNQPKMSLSYSLVDIKT